MYQILIYVANSFDRILNSIIKLRHYIPREALKSTCTEVRGWSKFSEFLK